MGPRGPTLDICAWYRFTCVYCCHIFIFEVCGMTYDWWRMCNTMELGSNCSHTEFFLSNNHIQTTSITKDLGAHFESNLKFKASINDIVNSAHQRSALIYRSFLPRDTNNLILAFKTYVRPLLENVSPVWSPTHVMLIRSVEAVQWRRQKFNVTRSKPGQLLSQPGQEKTRKLCHRATVCYSIIDSFNVYMCRVC